MIGLQCAPGKGAALLGEATRPNVADRQPWNGGRDAHRVGWAVGLVVYAALTALSVMTVSRSHSGANGASQIQRDTSIQSEALAPLLNDDLVAEVPEAIKALGVVSQSIVRDGDSIEIRVLSATGHLYWMASETDAVNELALGAAAGGAPVAEGVELLNLTNRDDVNRASAASKVIEVHTTFTTPAGTPVLVEAVYPSSLADASSLETTSTLGQVALLAAPQLLFVGVLSRRWNRNRHERERLLEHMIVLSDTERRRIAGSVHDGAVQDLIGVSLALQGAAVGTPEQVRSRIEQISGQTRAIVRDLRSLLNSIYPVDVPDSGWVAGLDDSVNALRQTGVHVTLDIPDWKLAPAEELLLLRVAREALRNVHAHAAASEVIVSLEPHGTRLRLSVVDNGVGFGAGEANSQRRDGHLGLQLICDLAVECGSVLQIESSRGKGTTVRLDLKRYS